MLQIKAFLKSYFDGGEWGALKNPTSVLLCDMLRKNQVLSQTERHCMHRKDLYHSLINLNASGVEEL